MSMKKIKDKKNRLHRETRAFGARWWRGFRWTPKGKEGRLVRTGCLHSVSAGDCAAFGGHKKLSNTHLDTVSQRREICFGITINFLSRGKALFIKL